MNIDSSSSISLAAPLQQRNESRTNEADVQARQSEDGRQSTNTSTNASTNDNRAQQRSDSSPSENTREDRSSEFALNQNRSISSLATQSAGESRGQSQVQQQEPNQEQVAARRREQIEQEISTIQNPNQGQPRLSIEV